MQTVAFAQSDLLAVQLADEDNHEAAAIEFRRLTIESPTDEDKGGYYWAAAYEYLENDNHDLVEKMLDQAEDLNPELTTPALLLRGENAINNKDLTEASFYFESLNRGSDRDIGIYSSRRLSTIKLRQRDVRAARDALDTYNSENKDAIDAIGQYASGHDKKPVVGGLLGIIPGLGHMYAGEYSNGIRSMILNGIFIFGMVHTADQEQWGAFTVITFFELTWYTGSIYGGIDASHRYNQRRLNDCIDTINKDTQFQPDYEALPSVSLKIMF